MLHSQVSPGAMGCVCSKDRVPVSCPWVGVALLLQKQKRQGSSTALGTSQCEEAFSQGRKKRQALKYYFKDDCCCHVLRQAVVVLLCCAFYDHAPQLKGQFSLSPSLLSHTLDQLMEGGVPGRIDLAETCPEQGTCEIQVA